MFSRLNVRTKLLVMLLPAALGLCGLAGLGVQTRLDERGVAQRNRDASTLASTASTFVHQMQAERLLAATSAAAGGNDQAAALAVQVGATDNAGAGLTKALRSEGAASLGDSGAQADLHDLADSIDRLRDVRSATASGTAGEVGDAYSAVIDLAMAAIGRLEIADSSGGHAGVGGAVSRRWLAEGIESEWATASTAAALFDADATPADRAATADTARELSDRAALFYGNYGDYAGRTGTERLQDARTSAAAVAADPYFDELAAPGAATTFTAEVSTWSDIVSSRMEAVETVEANGYRADVAQLTAAADDADSSAVYFAAGAAGSCLLVILLAFGVSRNISTTLRRLTESAREISQEQVPALVQSLKSGTGAISGLTFTEVDTGSGDEFGEVGAALNDLSRAMVTVATEQQQSLRKGISDIFVNLARRNQTLLDRQIQFIDRLEANEQDPDQLENLFRLDHLATRMRRNAESLLVLAGAEAPRRRARDVELSDVIRVAVGEVEDFARISLMAVEEAEAIGGAAVDVAHLLAELMENGAQYSPPEKTVDVVGHRAVDGGYVISITDHGVGMTAERLDAANRLLASPPPVGLALSRALGFVVAGTLANRHGIRVHLSASASGGVTAEVVVPPALILAVEAPAVGADAFLPAEDADHVDAAPVAPSAVYATEGFAAASFTAESFAGEPFTAELSSRVQPSSAETPSFSETPSLVAGWSSTGEYVSMPAAPVEPAAAVVPPPYQPAEPVGPPVPVNWGEEFLPTAPAPSKLIDMLPEGSAFEQGLYSLLDRAAPAAPTAPADLAVPTEPAAFEPSGFEPPAFPPPATPPIVSGSAPALPQRSPGATHRREEQPEIRTAAPQRAPDEVRSVLSRYRSGLANGHDSTANGHDSPASGHDSTASGHDSTASGHDNTANEGPHPVAPIQHDEPGATE